MNNDDSSKKAEFYLKKEKSQNLKNDFRYQLPPSSMDSGFSDKNDKLNNYPNQVITEKIGKKKEADSEIAKPGRTYTGTVISVGEDITIQKTEKGKLIIHETENLPGIKEQDTGSKMQVVYGVGGKGDITQKANDLEIAKEKQINKDIGLDLK